MNRSGWAVRCLVDRCALPPERCLVIYDEVALPLGRLRLRPRGGPAGHRGMESIVESLRTEEVPRLRLGLAPGAGPPPAEALSGFVLSPFAADELPVVEAALARAADAVLCWAEEGIEIAMARFNPAAAPLADGEPLG
jgi:PTH1 family peptidyl-tRNA hydrolase